MHHNISDLYFENINRETSTTSYNVPVSSVLIVSAAPWYAHNAVSRKRSVCRGGGETVTREIAAYQTRTSATSDNDDVDDGDIAATATIHQVPQALSDDTRCRYYFYGHLHYSSANALSIYELQLPSIQCTRTANEGISYVHLAGFNNSKILENVAIANTLQLGVNRRHAGPFPLSLPCHAIKNITT